MRFELIGKEVLKIYIIAFGFESENTIFRRLTDLNNRPSWYCTDCACCDHHMLFSLKYCTYENIIIIITALVIVTYCLILRERKKVLPSK